MVLRRFAAFDNEAFVVDASSPSLVPGSPIINDSDTPVGTIFRFADGFPYQTVELDDTSGDPDVFEDDQQGGHIITEGRGLVANGTQVESESYHFVRALDASGNETGPVITINVFSQGGVTQDIWGMAADARLEDGVRYVKVDGSVFGDSVYSTFVPCFTAGALIATRTGLRPIEEIAAGDAVMTRDNGFQTVHWAGRRDLGAAELAADPRFCPVRIRADALGRGGPDRDILLSPNHRVLLTGAKVALNCGTPEVLVAAKHLVGLPGVERLAPRPVSYVHLLFQRHEIVSVDTLWSESFLPGEVALRGMGNAQTEEILALFPELATARPGGRYSAARSILKRHEAVLARRTLAA